jgi:hypothetical protein
MLAIYKPRPHSYDQDWMQAFEKAGFTLSSKPCEFHDLTVILQSVTAQWQGIPSWIREQKGRGRILMFPGNEYKLFKEKGRAARELGAEIATQLPLKVAQKIYPVPVIEVPHALNPDYFVPGEKRYEMGCRGNIYPAIVGDDHRNRISSPSLWKGLNHDIKMGPDHFEGRKGWLKALQSWRTMPSCEGAAVNAKCVTPRHFDAIGAHACLVMYPGEYNGILKPEHYIRLEFDHSNLDDVLRQVRDAGHCLEIVSKAREYLCDSHTYAHRVKQVLAWA